MENLKITAVRREGSEIVSYKLSNGEVINKTQVLDYAMSGKLDGYEVATSVYGEPFLRTYRDGDKSNNLSDLPEF